MYAKGDPAGAVEQYIKTIGKLEASYVIRKFLESQYINMLIRYLQALHKQVRNNKCNISKLDLRMCKI